MSLDFERCVAEEYCIKVADGTHDSPKEVDYGKKLVTSKNIIGGKLDLDKSYFISLGDFDDINKRSKVDQWDILISMIGTVGEVALITEKPDFAIKNVGLLKNDNEYKAKWLYYYLKSDLGQYQIKSRLRGTTQLYIPLKDLRKLEISVPKDHDDMIKIIKILDNIDKKIENNLNINNNLENLLMEIFKSWFIYFEKYDKSNGMKIDESYGELPKLWSVEMLEDYVDFVTGVEPGSKNYHENPEVNDVPFLRVGDLGSRESTVFIDESLSKNKILTFEDIVLSLDATIGIVKIGLEGAYSTGMRKLVIKNNNINKPFLYCLIKSERIQKIIETFATGTTILHAGKSIKHMNFVLSDKYTMDKFAEIGNPILSTILSNLKEIEILINMRDTLLPKLMSGEIDVSKINCDLD